MLLTCSCEGVPNVAADFTPSERASLDLILAPLKRASLDAFDQEDWSIMAHLYPPNSFACMHEAADPPRYGYLSMTPIPDTVTIEIGDIVDYELGGFRTSPADATHYLVIAYEETFLEGCELPDLKRYPQQHFYLRREGGQFTLVHLCPFYEDEPSPGPQTYSVTSGKRAQEIAAGMSDEERAYWRRQVQSERFPMRAMDAIQRRYGLTEDESAITLSQICRKRTAAE